MGFDTVFDFEQDFAGALQCIPMAVRYKLDLCGIKLSLRQWSRFTEAERRALLLRQCEAAVEIAQYRDTLAELVSDRAGETAMSLPIEAAPVWADLDEVPRQISDYAGTLGVAPPTLAQWRSLSVLQRFTLLKLSRQSHDNVNFIPALQAFNLLPAKGEDVQG